MKIFDSIKEFKVTILSILLVTAIVAALIAVASASNTLPSAPVTVQNFIISFFSHAETPLRIIIMAGFSLDIMRTKYGILEISAPIKSKLSIALLGGTLAWTIALFYASIPLPHEIFEYIKPDAFQTGLFYLDYTHFGSMLTFIALFAFLLYKTSKPVFSFVAMLGAIAFIEFITIPIHLIIYNGAFMGMSWYLVFAMAGYPIVISRRRITITHKKLFIAILLIGVAVYYFTTWYGSIGWDFTYWNGYGFVFKGWDKLQGGFGQTIYHLLARLSKTLMVIPFGMLRLRKNENSAGISSPEKSV